MLLRTRWKNSFHSQSVFAVGGGEGTPHNDLEFSGFRYIKGYSFHKLRYMKR